MPRFRQNIVLWQKDYSPIGLFSVRKVSRLIDGRTGNRMGARATVG